MKPLLPEAVNTKDSRTDITPMVVMILALELKTEAGRTALRYALENIKLLDDKQLDYGSKNISRGGTFGCVLRMSDKFERIFNLFNNKRRRAVNESIKDSFRDVSNYAIISLMLENKQWPNE